MALSNVIVWEIRGTGNSDTNGAGFDSTFGGTDYSQQDTPQVAVNDIVTTAGSAVITSATAGFTSAMLGNLLTLNEGGVIRWYVVSIFTNSTTITLDRNTAGNRTGVAMRLGGACNIGQSGIQFATLILPGHHIWYKGTNSIITNGVALTVNGDVTRPITLEGYTAVRGDGGRGTLNWGSSGTFPLFTVSGNFNEVKNMSFDNGSNVNSTYVQSGNRCLIENCIIQGSTSNKLDVSGNNNVIKRSRVIPGGQNGDLVRCGGTNNLFEFNTLSGSQNGNGITVNGSGNSIINNIIRNNNQHGILYNTAASGGSLIRTNNIWNNGVDGIRLVSTTDGLQNVRIEYNILGRNGAYDVNYNLSDISTQVGTIKWALYNVVGNEFYTTGTGKSHFLPPFTGDVTLTANPFTDDTTTFDFSINSVTGGGALVKSSAAAIAFADGVNTATLVAGALSAPSLAIPGAPSGLVASVVSPTQVALVWTDNSNNEDNFVLERSVNGGAFVVLATLGGNVTSYSDTSTSGGTTYQYRVKAVNGAGSSAYSTSNTVNTPTFATGVVAAPVIDEVLFPVDLSYGAIGGPMFSTIVIEGSSGAEQRVGQWVRGRSHWDINMNDRDAAQAQTLYAFWLARQGKLRGFRFQDWFDYTASDEPLVPTGGPQIQLRKTYTSGSQTYVRPIVKPATGTVTLKRGGSPFLAFAIDTTTGILTLTPDNTKSITAITKAASAVVTVGSGHGFSVNDSVYFSGVGGMTQINGLIGTITATASTTVTVNINSTGFSTYTSGGTLASYIRTTETLTWTGQFHIPVRFDTDQMKMVQQEPTIRQWDSVPIVELVNQ